MLLNLLDSHHAEVKDSVFYLTGFKEMLVLRAGKEV